MSVIKLLNSINKISTLFFLLTFSNLLAVENKPVDIWQNKNQVNTKDEQLKKEDSENKPSINFTNMEENKIKEIEIFESSNPENEEIKLVGLYDPQENDLTLDMWSNSDG